MIFNARLAYNAHAFCGPRASRSIGIVLYSSTHPIHKQVFSEESILLCGSLCTVLSAGA